VIAYFAPQQSVVREGYWNRIRLVFLHILRCFPHGGVNTGTISGCRHLRILRSLMRASAIKSWRVDDPIPVSRGIGLHSLTDRVNSTDISSLTNADTYSDKSFHSLTRTVTERPQRRTFSLDHLRLMRDSSAIRAHVPAPFTATLEERSVGDSKDS